MEFTTDGTWVNTTEGWREMKVGIFSKRERGVPATPDEWDTRVLPPPQVRVAFAAIEDSQAFGQRWHAWRRRLGLADTSGITLLADGAKWIWEEQRRHLPHAEGVLDVYHALAHVAELGQNLVPEPQAWIEAARKTLLHGGWRGINAHIVRTTPQATGPQRAAIDQLLDYLGPHRHHLNYRARLDEGRSIGSGQVEGACKNLIGRRLQQTGARWRVRRVNRMAGLCCLMYSHQWNTYWESP